MKLVKKSASKAIESSDLERICHKFDLSKEIVELLFIRNIDDDEKIEKFLHPSERDFYDPFLLSGMTQAVEKIRTAIKENKKITIFGDYDVDGVSATAILILFFLDEGINVSHFMPNRYVDGYGLSNDAIDKCKQNFGTELLITVDCGISCYKEVEYAKSLGIDVIITDHHDIPDILPDTITINAKLPNQAYPFRELCGAGVAFKLTQALRGLDYAKKFLSIACIATIADIVPLIDENRAIVKLGLEHFFEFLPKGVAKLYYKLELDKPNATEISFKLTPRINASGRMGSADTSLQLYLEDDDEKIDKLIEDILSFNAQRQELCNVVYDECCAMLEKKNLANSRVIVLASEKWDSGVLGIVSARLTEEYWRPTFLFAIEDDGICSGSGRSIPNINIHSCLNELKILLESFGGHMMAAGVKIRKENLQNFEQSLDKIMHNNYPASIFVPQKKFDIDIDLDKIDKNFIHSLDILEPLGSENPRPLFKIQFSKSNAMIMKNHPNHLTLNLNNIKAVGFNLSKWQDILNQSTMKEAIVELGLDVYKGTESTRMFLKNISPSKNLKIGDNEKLVGEYLRQLEFICKYNNSVQYTLYDYNNLKDLIKDFDRATGTLIISNTYGSFTAFTNDKELDDFVSAYFYRENIEDKGHNTIILCPSLDNKFNIYSNIVFLDAVLDKSFLAYLNTKTNAKIYVPKNIKIQQKLINDIDLSRKTFGYYYSIIMNMLNTNKNYSNLYDFYQKCKNRFGGEINFVEFSLVEMVFKELGILIELQSENSVIYELDTNISTQLENSKIFNKATQLKMENSN